MNGDLVLWIRGPARFLRVRAVGVALRAVATAIGRGGKAGALRHSVVAMERVCVGGGGYAGRVPGVTWCAARRVLLSVGPGAAQPERGCEVSSRRGEAAWLGPGWAGTAPRAPRAGGDGVGRHRWSGRLFGPVPRLIPLAQP